MGAGAGVVAVHGAGVVTVHGAGDSAGAGVGAVHSAGDGAGDGVGAVHGSAAAGDGVGAVHGAVPDWTVSSTRPFFFGALRPELDCENSKVGALVRFESTGATTPRPELSGIGAISKMVCDAPVGGAIAKRACDAPVGAAKVEAWVWGAGV